MLIKANPDAQISMCRHVETCFFGEYPTLNDLSEAFEKNTPVLWLIPQLNDLSEYCGCKDKLMGKTLEQCAEIIAYNFGYLKITEIMLFFYRLKLSRYEKFYGSIDPLIIMKSMQEFLRERNVEYCHHEQQEREAAERESKKNCITWEEYCRRRKISKESPLTIFKQQ